VLLRLAYLGVTNALAMLGLLAGSDRAKDVEILALRHQIMVLERRLSGAKVRFAPADRAFLAALLHRLPVRCCTRSARSGSAVVFRASRSIPVGADFVPCLLTALRGCSVLLVVIGRRWLHGANGAPSRLHTPTDWRREIADAFDNGVRVVPVLLDTAPSAARPARPPQTAAW
jgi:hypothetical protein